MPSKARPIETMTNPGGIGAAIAAREAKLQTAVTALYHGQDPATGRDLTPNKRSRWMLKKHTLEAELKILYERRAIAARATAHRAPAAKISDWE